MARFDLKWEQPRVERNVFNAIRRNARAAGRHVRDEMRKQVSQTGGRRGSSPGSPPLRRTGLLRKEIKHAVSARQNRKQVTIKIGPTFRAFYGRFLQFGTKYSAARPFVDTSVMQRAKEAAMRILARGRP